MDNTICILYEKDYQVRERLELDLIKENISFETCYSLSKLHLLKRKNPHSALLLFVNKNDEDLVEISTHFPNTVTYEYKDIQNLEFFKVHIESAKRAEGLDKYQLDLLCIGSSTGGLPVLQNILKGLNAKKTITIVCQHVNKVHTEQIKEALLRCVQSRLVVVTENSSIRPGIVYLLGGGRDFKLVTRYDKLHLVTDGLSEENYHPSFNCLLESLSKIKNQKSGCIILSGLGDDGSKHLKSLKAHNVKILVQDPDTATAPYMPKAAMATGHVDMVYSEEKLYDFIRRSVA